MHDATRVTRAGVPGPRQGEPFLPGPVFAAPFHAAGDAKDAPYIYARTGQPTWTHYESALSELEGGPAVLFASGMAAVAAVFGAVLRPGDRVVLPTDSYFGARELADTFFKEMGVVVQKAPTAGSAQAELVDGARLIWLETPSNPNLDVCDIAQIVARARATGALVAVDNTTATVLAQRPLALGADFSVASDTKAMSGHSDLLLGHVAVRDSAWADRVRAWRTLVGAAPGPMEVWLAHRSLATLDVRLERQNANALALARYLKRRPELVAVRYPGLPDDPAHAVAVRQMSRFGTILGLTFADRARAEAFLGRATLITEATSFGGVHTTAERRMRWGADSVSEGFVRLSVGVEHIDDLIADIDQALIGVAPTSAAPEARS